MDNKDLMNRNIYQLENGKITICRNYISFVYSVWKYEQIKISRRQKKNAKEGSKHRKKKLIILKMLKKLLMYYSNLLGKALMMNLYKKSIYNELSVCAFPKNKIKMA